MTAPERDTSWGRASRGPSPGVEAGRALAQARQQADEAREGASRADDAFDEAHAAVAELDNRHEGLTQRLHELEQVAHRALDRARQRVERLT